MDKNLKNLKELDTKIFFDDKKYPFWIFSCVAYILFVLFFITFPINSFATFLIIFTVPLLMSAIFASIVIVAEKNYQDNISNVSHITKGITAKIQLALFKRNIGTFNNSSLALLSAMLKTASIKQYFISIFNLKNHTNRVSYVYTVFVLCTLCIYSLVTINNYESIFILNIYIKAAILILIVFFAFGYFFEFSKKHLPKLYQFRIKTAINKIVNTYQKNHIYTDKELQKILEKIIPIIQTRSDTRIPPKNVVFVNNIQEESQRLYQGIDKFDDSTNYYSVEDGKLFYLGLDYNPVVKVVYFTNEIKHLNNYKFSSTNLKVQALTIESIAKDMSINTDTVPLLHWQIYLSQII